MGPTALGLFSMQAKPEKLRETYLATTFLSVPIFVGTALVADQLIPLVFGAQWLDATWALQAFCPIGLHSFIGILQAALIRAKGRADWWMWYQVVQQVLTVLVVVMLYPYGITAVVVGIAVKAWLVWPFVATAAGRMIDLSFGRYLAQFAPLLLGCVVMVGVVLGLGSWMEDWAILTLIAQIAAGVLTYAVTLVLTARHRLQGLRQTLRKKR
ncbi:oligosaccharide flippase family protein [Paracoccus hibiscisoli]|uniref:oligosaccharide flippase family protein n=1 Tax=Paracoccus hibiscisoli TaxID=2023261 RepID=UPI0023F11CAC|nr:oligosaccharide flippase family protein [Paracoccus hibiscisoli]